MQDDIRTFLESLKDAVREKRYRVVKRPVNRQFIIQNGFNIDDIEEILMGLTILDYKKGPESDRDGYPGTIMVFLPVVNRLRVYIKIRIWNEGNADQCVIISFHEGA